MSNEILDKDLNAVSNTKFYKISLIIFCISLCCIIGMIIGLFLFPETDDNVDLAIGGFYFGLTISNFLSLGYLVVSFVKKEDKSGLRNVIGVLNLLMFCLNVIMLSMMIYEGVFSS